MFHYVSVALKNVYYCYFCCSICKVRWYKIRYFFHFVKLSLASYLHYHYICKIKSKYLQNNPKYLRLLTESSLSIIIYI